MDKITEITPAVYVCGRNAINDYMLKELGITLIINVTKGLSHYDVSSLQSNINLVRIPVIDHEDTLLYPYFSVSILYFIIIMKYFAPVVLYKLDTRKNMLQNIFSLI